MSTENSHPNSNPTGETEGDGSGKALESLFAEGETAEDFVKRVNEKAGTNYADFDTLVKSVGESSKLSAELGRLKKEKGLSDDGKPGDGTQTPPANNQQTPPAQRAQTDDVVELFFDQNKDAALVRQDLERVAQAQGRSVISVWKDKENEGWLHEKSANLKKTAETRERVADPSGQSHGRALSEEEKHAKRLATNLPPGFSAEPPKL